MTRYSKAEAAGTMPSATQSSDSDSQSRTFTPRISGYSNHSFAKEHAEVVKARKIYLKTFVGGTFLVVLTVFAVFSIYWGSLWKVPAHPLNGWIVDFDGGDVGAFFSQNMLNQSNSAIKWSSQPAGSIGSMESLQVDVVEERAWVAVSINSGASENLNASLQNPNPSYNGSLAVTIYGNEARNENAYRSLIMPTISRTLETLSHIYASRLAQRTSSSAPPPSLANLLSVSPQTVTAPVSYTIVNLRPFDEPVATATTLVGLIYLLILSFYIVMIGDGARNSSGITKFLSFPALVLLRLASSIMAYFVLSLAYSLLNLAFQVDFSRKFGAGGFVIYWMLNWVGMLAVGLALESLITILTPRFIPFFMILWIIVNVSVCIFPIQALPSIFRYGYAAPFYNVSRAFRTIGFRTKNEVGLNFGILFAWAGISCVTLLLFQWIVWRRDRRVANSSN